jgi:hypothetical protein
MQTAEEARHRRPYVRLLLMVALSFVAMYVLMYAMVNTFANVHPNLNQFYMAGLMAAPMAIIELGLMGAMYHDRRMNGAVVAAALIASVAFWAFIRQQAAITDVQFLKSMIPHHAGAILMCEQAPLRDPAIRDLCKTIISSQQSEIDQMHAMLARLEEK